MRESSPSRSDIVRAFGLALALLVAVPAHADPYDDFHAFAQTAFGAEQEPLVYERFGGILDMPRDWWTYVSERSAAIGFTSNLPARSHIEYGPEESYRFSTEPTDRHYSVHLHHLTGLEPGVRHAYRVVMVDERGNTVRSSPREITPVALDKAIRIPGDLPGPPYVLSRSNTHYLVEEDIHAPQSAFIIAADEVMLDLGGHLVTYDNTPVTVEGGWNRYIEEASFGIRSQGGRGIRIANGHVRQGSASGAGHPSESIGFNAVFLRESSHIEVAGVTLEYSGTQVTGLHAMYPSGFNSVHHNVFIDRGTELTNRHGTGSKSLAIGGDVSTFHTHHNLVKRTRQSALDGGRINDNEIYIDSHATNSYGIPSLVDDREAYGNRIFGTGYHVVGIGWGAKNHWHDNFIHLAGQGTSDRSSEYGGQESLNGFRLTQYADSDVDYSGNIVEDNLVVISDGGCNDEGSCTIARGLQWFSDPHVRNNLIRNNTIKVVMNDGVTRAAALVTQGLFERCGTEAPVQYSNNRLISNITTLRLGDSYGVGCNHVFTENTLVRVGERDDFRTFRFAFPVATTGQFMYDTQFEGGADPGSVHFSNPEQELTVGWTLEVRVLDGSDPVAGADVVYRAADGSPLAIRSTNDQGIASARVPQYVQTQAGRTDLGPIEITVMHAGATRTHSIDVTETMSVDVVIDD